MDTQNLDAVKNNHIEPSKAGLADCKDTDRMALTSIGITCPYIYKKENYYGYKIIPDEESSNALFSFGRFINVLKCRYGAFNIAKGLLLDGATSSFYELPQADSAEMQDFYDKANELMQLDLKNN